MHPAFRELLRELLRMFKGRAEGWEQYTPFPCALAEKPWGLKARDSGIWGEVSYGLSWCSRIRTRPGAQRADSTLGWSPTPPHIPSEWSPPGPQEKVLPC
jgi:hypothetical protein